MAASFAKGFVINAITGQAKLATAITDIKVKADVMFTDATKNGSSRKLMCLHGITFLCNISTWNDYMISYYLDSREIKAINLITN